MKYCSCFAQRSLTPTVLDDKILNNSRHLSFTSSQGFPSCHRRAHKRRMLGWAESFPNSTGARRLNSRHFTTPKLVSPPNDVWETSAEIPYWWRIFWLVEANFPRCTTTTRYQYGIFVLVSQTSFRQETSRWRHSVGATVTGLILVTVNSSPPNLLIHLDIASLWSRGQCVPRNVTDQVSPLSGQLLGSKCSEAQNFLQASQYVWKQSQKL